MYIFINVKAEGLFYHSLAKFSQFNMQLIGNFCFF